MKTPLITVRSAGSTRPGFAQITLQVSTVSDPATSHDEWITGLRERRALTAAVYCVAARLEQIASTEALELEVSVGQIRLGVIDVDTRKDALDDDIITEIVIEACVDCGFTLADQ
jgi:hypothetical protein